MSIEAKKEYLKAILLRYQNSTRDQKSKILDEFCSVCGYSRKYAITLLSRGPKITKSRPGRSSVYDNPALLKHLVRIWLAMNKICSKKLVAAMPLWIEHYGPLDSKTKKLLLNVSSSTVDRLFKKHRIRKRTHSSTVPSMFKTKIPLELLDKSITYPGFVEADTVVHCGQSMAGEYAVTLTVTDVYSGWTENRASWTKSSFQIAQSIMEIENELPFNMVGFATDNGSEFLNYRIKKYFEENRKNKIKFVRRRPYKKNDNAHVEQKNWTHVRQLFGYDRIDQYELIELMNDIYANYWNPLQNFFIPTMKLKEKIRHGGKVKKRFEDLKTPFQRVMDSDKVSDESKEILRSSIKGLNPFKLKATLDERLNEFRSLINKIEVAM